MATTQVNLPETPTAQVQRRAAEAKNDAAAATTVPQLRAQVTLLAELVETLAQEFENRPAGT